MAALALRPRSLRRGVPYPPEASWVGILPSGRNEEQVEGRLPQRGCYTRQVLLSPVPATAPRSCARVSAPTARIRPVRSSDGPRGVRPIEADSFGRYEYGYVHIDHDAPLLAGILAPRDYRSRPGGFAPHGLDRLRPGRSRGTHRGCQRGRLGSIHRGGVGPGESRVSVRLGRVRQRQREIRLRRRSRAWPSTVPAESPDGVCEHARRRVRRRPRGVHGRLAGQPGQRADSRALRQGPVISAVRRTCVQGRRLPDLRTVQFHVAAGIGVLHRKRRVPGVVPGRVRRHPRRALHGRRSTPRGRGRRDRVGGL